MANPLTRPHHSARGLVLHQLLHGYSEGHRLLESSFKLPDDLTRLMLRMSDLSGSSIVTGFEDYITGYPLAPMDAYALGRTWYASEMPRPGCVWTHTIVIPAPVLGDIPHLGALLGLFRRPVGNRFKGHYSEDLPLDEAVPEEPVLFQREGSGIDLGRLVWSYYGMHGKPVIIAAKSSHEFEGAVLSLWSQQWPALRLGFTFCTGSLSTRNLGGRPLDVQCVPVPLSREALAETANIASTEPVLIPSNETNIPQWMSTAVVDAAKPRGGSFRCFLWEVAESTAGRDEFLSFTKVFDIVQRAPQLDSLVALVADLFPDPSAGGHLKSLLFGNKSTRVFFPNAEEHEVLLVLATTEHHQCFSAEALSMRQRGAALCIERPELARWLVEELFRSTLNPLGEEVLAGLISAMDPESARRVTEEQPQFLPGLFRAKPSLACAPELWVAGRARRRELFESVAVHEDLSSTTVAGIVSAMLESGSDELIGRAVERWGRDAVFPVLDWADAHSGALSWRSQGAVASRLSFVMDWVYAEPTRSAAALAAVAHVVAPRTSEILHYDSTIWLQAFNDLQSKQTGQGEVLYLGTFLLALAFGNAPPLPLGLISASFDRIHEAAAEERLSDDAWFTIEPLVPKLSWRKNWDKCERLRRGLVGAFVRYKWHPVELRRVVGDYSLRREVLDTANRIELGWFFRGVE